ncbi:hypothetical protein CERSUDRAFT_112038 [Gelatoporia subvermispora B]|uniref:RNA-polymerase II-associated protein 3-like C-terminal domain-containing protein n=1 Tax=Ceriporiopsis subvermispora (strain B) TaxID=914234 RepID=M2RMQ2_CERS8|nr:hypothetical protein CERSUDRAFT_112038 [Gelatoporia subvermispora B]
MFGPKETLQNGAAPPSTNASSAAPSSTALSHATKSTPGATPLRRVDLSKGASTGVKAPMTLFAFQQRWEQLQTPESRWALMNEIPPPALPALFQSSLDASLLSSILSTFLTILHSPPVNANGEPDPTLSAEDIRVRVRAYLVWLARVPRFGTVVLFMSKEERGLVQDVWSAVGVGAARTPEADEGEKEVNAVREGMRAWGAS